MDRIDLRPCRYRILYVLSIPVSVVCGLGLLGSEAEAAETAAGGTPAIVVTNFTDGDTIRYPVPLIEGTLADEAATSLVVENRSSSRDTRRMTGLAHKGRFKALAELVPG
ncbi:MAG: hypothetical protein ACYSU0_17365, partial [Planctomycetota bacterium]